MRVLIEWSGAAERQMARDAKLFETLKAGETALRIYDWDRPALTIGSNRPLDPPIGEAAREHGICVYRRPTSGDAVLHGHDVTIALTVRSPQPGKRISPRWLIRSVGERMIGAFGMLGIRAVQGSNAVGRSSSQFDCFNNSAPADIAEAETGVKLIGCAYRVAEHGALLQASIPVRRPIHDRPLFGHEIKVFKLLERDAVAEALAASYSDF